MASRRPTKPTTKPKATKQEETTRVSFIQKTKQVFQNERFQFIAGIALAVFVIYALIAFVSFFFTGKADASILEQGLTKANRNAIHNITGVPGAMLTNFLVNGVFGLSVLALYYQLAVWAIHLMHIRPISTWRKFFISVFILIWGSTTLSFIQTLTGVDSFFHWGGGHGEWLSGGMVSYIRWIGTTLILVATLLIFYVCIDRRSIERMQQWWHSFVQLFHRKPKKETTTDEEEIDVQETEGEEEQSEVLSFNMQEGSEEITVEEPTNEPIEPIEEEETPEEETSDEEPAQEDIGMQINEVEETELNEDDPDYILKKEGPYDPRLDLSSYKFPSINLLRTYENETRPVVNMEEQNANKNRIVNALKSYGIEITNITATIGPTVTLYEIVPKEGIKLSRIKSLEDDIMMSLAAKGIRIIAPIPGKSAVGIEVPNEKPQIVSMHSIIASKRFQDEQKMRLPVAIGKTITNEIFMFDLAKTPHLLVAGATGMGKSVGLNAIITSLLYKKHPAELKFVLIDPKKVEFSLYNKLEKHYMALMPDAENVIITDSTKVIQTLNSLVVEMENRFELLEAAGCRNLEEYNEKFINRRLNPEKGHRYMPYIVIIIDEYGDFILVAGKEVETPIQRLTQKARAVGMHMILATQRPSVNVITGVIKSNVPTRIAFAVRSFVDSKTVLDSKGAEQLIGRGDMLYLGSGTAPIRIQCALVETEEVEEIVQHVSEQKGYPAAYELPEYVAGEGNSENSKPGSVDLKKLDPLFVDIARYIVLDLQSNMMSISNLQRRFQIGFNRAGKISDQLEAAGIVGPTNGPKGKPILVQDEGTLEMILRGLM